MTKAQKEEKARNERKLQQMLAAGIKVGPSEEGEKKKAVYDNKKKGGRKAQDKVNFKDGMRFQKALSLTYCSAG